MPLGAGNSELVAGMPYNREEEKDNPPNVRVYNIEESITTTPNPHTKFHLDPTSLYLCVFKNHKADWGVAISILVD